MFKNLKYKAHYAVLVFVASLLGAELILYCTDAITKKNRFTPEHKDKCSEVFYKHDPNLYPSNPDQYIKIAVFGGSATNGYNSPRKYFDILEYEVPKLYPSLKFYFKNFGEMGRPFHRQEAELAKSALPYFDILLIYQGNGEGLNYIEDIGYFRKPSLRAAPILQSPKYAPTTRNTYDFFGFTKCLAESNLRISKFLDRLKYNYINPIINKNAYGFTQFKEFADQAVIPPHAIEEMNKNYRQDLLEITRTAQKLGKKVLISSETSDETFKPYFSVLDPALPKSKRDEFLDLYKRATILFHNEEFTDALNLLNRADKIQQNVAIIDYYMGLCFLKIGNHEMGRYFLQKAIDNDGLPVRENSQQVRSAREIAAKFSNAIFVDAAAKFRDLVDKNNFKPIDLFTDSLHPTFLGHVVLSNVFLCALTKILPAEQLKGTTPCLKADYVSMAKNYAAELKISSADEAYHAYWTARSAVSFAARSAYPNDFLELAKIGLKRYYETSQKAPSDLSTYYLYMFIIEGLGNANATQALELINKAYSYSPEFFLDSIKHQTLATGEAINDILSKLNIYFSKSKGMFFIIEK